MGFTALLTGVALGLMSTLQINGQRKGKELISWQKERRKAKKVKVCGSLLQQRDGADIWYRWRFFTKRTILVVGAVYHDNVTHHSTIHELSITTKEDRSGTRNSGLHICWFVIVDNSVDFMLTSLGMTVGLALRVTSGNSIQNLVSFDYQIFFNLLLPPIILASGYELHQSNFFRNIGTILTFAFAGTFISAIVLGLILWCYTRINFDGFEEKLSFVDAISVGATLSATDPVTILAIFNTYKVDPKLYTIIFGESILNDAVAIVLFETAQRYKEGGAASNLGVLSLFEGVGFFLGVFFGSLIIGVIIGIGTALMLKYTYVRRFPKIESCLIVLIAYASYFFSNGIHMSGKSLTSTQIPSAKIA